VALLNLERILVLYNCVECDHKISGDAWRCPNCGTSEAGSRAIAAAEMIKNYERNIARGKEIKKENEDRDKIDPTWREKVKVKNENLDQQIKIENSKISSATNFVIYAIIISIFGQFSLFFGLGIYEKLGLSGSLILLMSPIWFPGLVYLLFVKGFCEELKISIDNLEKEKDKSIL